jgi:hypothetical protein
MKFLTGHSNHGRDQHLVKDEQLKKFWDDLADDWLELEDQKSPNKVPSEKTSSQN